MQLWCMRRILQAASGQSTPAAAVGLHSLQTPQLWEKHAPISHKQDNTDLLIYRSWTSKISCCMQLLFRLQTTEQQTTEQQILHTFLFMIADEKLKVHATSWRGTQSPKEVIRYFRVWYQNKSAVFLSFLDLFDFKVHNHTCYYFIGT